MSGSNDIEKRGEYMMKYFIQFIALLFIFCTSLWAQELPGFYVKGRHLYDPCGEKVILRGVANPHIWFLSDALDWLEEIENTGANCVRIVWNISGSAEALDEAISTCIDLDMIPMIECHDATCDLSMLDEVVDYWTSDDILEIAYKYR
jgi:mannan endo-1,4-beta-mannosidase